jgi:hypothetical protein
LGARLSFIAFLVIVSSALVVWQVNPVICRARSRFQPGTERWELFLLWLMLSAMVAEIPLATFDSGGSDCRPSGHRS